MPDPPPNLRSGHAAFWRRFFCVAIFLTVGLQSAIRLVLHGYLEHDDAEQLVFAQSMAWGYSPQPPLYTWILWCVVQFVGVNVASLTIVKASLLTGFYFLLYRLCLRLLDEPRLACLAALSPMLTPLIAWEVPRMTHTLLLCVITIGTLLAALNVRGRGTWLDYLALGVMAALGMLAKYNHALFALAIFLAATWDRPMRAAVCNGRMLASLGVAGIILLPHGWWLIEHREQAIARFAARTLIDSSGVGGNLDLWTFWHAVSHLLQVIVIAIATLVASWLTFFATPIWSNIARRKPVWSRAAAKSSPSEIDFLLAVAIIALVLWLVLMVMTGGRHFRSHWLVPVLLLAPPLLFDRLRPVPVTQWRFRGYAALVSVSILGLTTFEAATIAIAGDNGKIQTRDFLMQSQAGLAASAGFHDGTVIVLDPLIGGYLRLYFPNATIVCLPYLSNHDSRETLPQPLLVVWDLRFGKDVPIAVRRFLATHGREKSDDEVVQSISTIPRLIGGKMNQLGVLLLPPNVQLTSASKQQRL